MRTHHRQKLTRLSIDLGLGALIAIAFSAFIYAAHFELELKALNTLLGLGALYGLLVARGRTVLIGGFFIGILWFYWIGFSFSYYDFAWMVPLVSIGFGFVYLLYFGVLALTDRPWLRAIILLGMGYWVAPFGFNWMQLPLIFLDSYLGTEWWQFALILAALAATATIRHPARLAALLLLAGAFSFTPDKPKTMPPLSIKLVTTHVPQELKWLPGLQDLTVQSNMAAIETAANGGHDMVVLPESVFPLYLNRHPELIDQLKHLSKQIAIVTGALLDENGQHFNVTYIFQDGQMQIAKKMFLVPFGEYIPLPGFLRETVNDLFFDGASDYAATDTPTDFTVKGVRFRNAICYEATCEPLYADRPAYIVAISNNAWFMPSIEPTLQELLIRYYAQRYGTVIFHTTNMSGSQIVE